MLANYLRRRFNPEEDDLSPPGAEAPVSVSPMQRLSEPEMDPVPLSPAPLVEEDMPPVDPMTEAINADDERRTFGNMNKVGQNFTARLLGGQVRGMEAQPSEEARLLAAQKAQQTALRDNLAQKYAGEGRDLQKSQQELQRERQAMEAERLARGEKVKAAQYETEQQRKDREDKLAEAKFADERARGWKGLKIQEEKADAKGPQYDEEGRVVLSTAERRQKMRENALEPRGGWEKIQPDAPAFRDTTQARAFDTAEAAFGALGNHRKHAAEAMEKFRNAKTIDEKDAALAVVNQQMANIASKLRVAEGLNSSDASNHAVDTMLSLSNGSVASLRNFANEGRLDAILDSSIASAKTNLDTMAASNNLRPKGAAPAAHGEPTAEAPPPPPDATKVTVTDGKKYLRISKSQVASAEKDGWKVVAP